jgi:hypothetical protein
VPVRLDKTLVGEGRAALAAVVEVPLERLRPWPENPRRIRPERLEDLKRALSEDREMLRARPLLALPDGTVIAGNQRLLAARELGWQTIPVLNVDLDPGRARLWALRRQRSSPATWIPSSTRRCEALLTKGDHGSNRYVCQPGATRRTRTRVRAETVRRYAEEAGFSSCEVLPIENDFWRFYCCDPSQGPGEKKRR